jgi:hypothetical protein
MELGRIDNFAGPNEAILATLKAVNANQYAAYRVEFTTWNGMRVHAGYYQEGVIIITIPGGTQHITQNGVIYASTSVWNYETINGVLWAKHTYGNGVCVYSSDFSQFVVVP